MATSRILRRSWRAPTSASRRARRGVPVTGRLSADYNGRGDTVTLARSFLQLPHTRIDLSGSLGRQIQVNVVSRDLADFKPLGEIPVTAEQRRRCHRERHHHRQAERAECRRAGAAHQLRGRWPPVRPADRQHQRKPAAGGRRQRGAGAGTRSGAVLRHRGLTNWKAPPTSLCAPTPPSAMPTWRISWRWPESPDIPVTGALTADAHVAGTIGSPTGNADLCVVNGAIEGEKFDSLAARAVMTPQSIDVPSLPAGSRPFADRRHRQLSARAQRPAARHPSQPMLPATRCNWRNSSLC